MHYSEAVLCQPAMKHLDFDALRKAFTGLLWSAPYQCVCPYHTPLVAAVALSTHEGHQSSGPPVCVVSWCLLGSVTSCSQDHFWFWADSGKWPGLKKMFSSFLVPLVLSHGVEGYPTGDKHQAVWAFPPFGVTDKLILHSFSRKWFSRRDLGKT